MVKVPMHEVKQRTKKLADLFHSYETYSKKLNEIQEVLVTEVAHDNLHFVGHNKFYEQVLVPKYDKYMGKIMKVSIKKTKKYCLIGQPLDDGFSPAIAVNNSKYSNQCDKSPTSMFYSLIFVILAIIVRMLWLLFQN